MARYLLVLEPARLNELAELCEVCLVLVVGDVYLLIFLKLNLVQLNLFCK